MWRFQGVALSPFGLREMLISHRHGSVLAVFALPLADDDGEVRLAPSAPQPRILLVEDDCDIVSILVDEITEFGCSVVGPAATVAEATAIASTAALDAALVDVELRLDSALPVAQILFDRHVPFAFMTGDDIPEGTFDDVPRLMKPFTVAELRDALQRILTV